MHFLSVNKFFEYISQYIIVNSQHKKYVFWYDFHDSTIKVLCDGTMKYLREAFDDLKINDIYQLNTKKASLVPNILTAIMILDHYKSKHQYINHDCLDKIMTEDITFDTNAIDVNGNLIDCIFTYSSSGEKSLKLVHKMIFSKKYNLTIKESTN